MYGVGKSHNKCALLNYLKSAFHSSSSSSIQCHYATLGVIRNASEQDIRSAYIQMAKKYHPDVSTEYDSTQKFSSINQAYSILSDKRKKHKYDTEIGNNYNRNTKHDDSCPNWWDFNFYASKKARHSSNNDFSGDFEFDRDFYGDFSRFTTNTNKKKRKRDGFEEKQSVNNPYSDYYYYYQQQMNHKSENKENVGNKENIWSDFEFEFDIEQEFDSEFNNEAFWRFLRKNNKKQRTKHKKNETQQKTKHNNEHKAKHNNDDEDKAKHNTKSQHKTGKKESKNEEKTRKNNKNKNKNEITVNDICISLDLDFIDAVNGCTKTIEFMRFEICSSCGGSSFEASVQCIECVKCSGKGVLYGFNECKYKYKCVECNGRGMIFKNCTNCAGKCYISVSKSLSIRIPSGIRENDRVRVSKCGHQYIAENEAIKYGHIVISCNIGEHEYFERVNNDIHCVVNIPYGLAVLGGSFVVPTIYGPIIQKVNAAIHHEDTLQINEKGIYDSSTNKMGHHFVHFRINIADANTMTNQQKQLLNQYTKLEEAPKAIKNTSNIHQFINKKKNKKNKKKKDNNHNDDDDELNDLL